MEDGSWKMEVGRWKMEDGKCSGRVCSAVAGQASRLAVSGDYEE